MPPSYPSCAARGLDGSSSSISSSAASIFSSSSGDPPVMFRRNGCREPPFDRICSGYTGFYRISGAKSEQSDDHQRFSVLVWAANAANLKKSRSTAHGVLSAWTWASPVTLPLATRSKAESIQAKCCSIQLRIELTYEFHMFSPVPNEARFFCRADESHWPLQVPRAGEKEELAGSSRTAAHRL